MPALELKGQTLHSFYITANTGIEKIINSKKTTTNPGVLQVFSPLCSGSELCLCLFFFFS